MKDVMLCYGNVFFFVLLLCSAVMVGCRMLENGHGLLDFVGDDVFEESFCATDFCAFRVRVAVRFCSLFS